MIGQIMIPCGLFLNRFKKTALSYKQNLLFISYPSRRRSLLGVNIAADSSGLLTKMAYKKGAFISLRARGLACGIIDKEMVFISVNFQT